MQRFKCPFCGFRNETEFHFAVETGHPRPEPAAEVSDEEWAQYLYSYKSPKGAASEIWLHVTCGEYFIMHRDTVTREIIGSEPLPGVDA